MGWMQQTLYSMVKVNNEIELCEVGDLDCKQAIERELLQNRISYFIRWNKGGIFRLGRKKGYCIFCVNDNAAQEAESVINTLCEQHGYQVRFLLRKTKNKYF